MNPAHVKKNVRIVLAQKQNISHVWPVAMEKIEVHFSVQLDGVRKQGSVRLIQAVALPGHVACVYLNWEV